VREGGQQDRGVIAVRGMGAVSPVGVGVREFIRGLREGRSGIAPHGIEDERLRSTVAAVCSGFEPLSVMGRGDLDRVPRLVPMALAAAREAMKAAGLADPLDESDMRAARDTALVLGTGGGGIDFTLSQAAAFHGGGRLSLWTITNATHGNLAGELSIRLGLHGASLCVSTGCASSSDAIGLACDLLRSERPGSPRRAVVVGADAHVRAETLLGMELLGVLSTRDWRGRGEEPGACSRPFDAGRDGFVLGEGAWALVLEGVPAGAVKDLPTCVGEIAGYGATCDAHHRVRPAPDMEESARAMRLAMDDAGVRLAEIDAVQYHGTSTALNDALETRAVRLSLGPHAARVRGSSIKSMIGHPQGACGAASVVAMLGAMGGLDGGGPFIPPTINLESPDAECDLDYTAGRVVDARARVALVNCLAFGAKNSAIVLRVPGC
jgi:3-oxoacyl-[acyl-carrier-protein] synthase II